MWDEVEDDPLELEEDALVDAAPEVFEAVAVLVAVLVAALSDVVRWPAYAEPTLSALEAIDEAADWAEEASPVPALRAALAMDVALDSAAEAILSPLL